MQKHFFGNMPDGRKIGIYTIQNDNIALAVMDRGAAIVRLYAYGRDVVGGFDRLLDYISDTSHQGAVIGRVANRIANCRFTMDGKEYILPDNDNGCCLHGGEGFSRRVWSLADMSDNRITMTYTSKDMEEGFPSEVSVWVSYTLTQLGLMIDYTASAKGKTPISLTNHSYFNLNGLGKDILTHKAIIYADSYTEVNDKLIPTGRRLCVNGGALDFRVAHSLGERISMLNSGYDHNFILKPERFKQFGVRSLGLAAQVWGDDLRMNVYTDQPGLQLYTGNYLGDGPNFKGDIKQVKYGALCLETQTEPNSVNHGTGFYDVGSVYRHTTVYEFEKI